MALLEAGLYRERLIEPTANADRAPAFADLIYDGNQMKQE